MRASGVAAIVAVAAVAVVAAAAMGSASVPLDRPLRLPFSYGRDVTDTNVTAVCWKATVDRGVGKPISWCNTTEGLEKSGLLCYPKCNSGYDGVGPVCWEQCPSGWVDEGALCREKGSIKTIAKKSYGRGAGYPLTCDPSVPVMDAGLCYVPCPAAYDGVGPVCWESCPADRPIDGGALCCDNAADCTSKIRDLCAGLPIAIMKAILGGEDPSKIIQAVIDAINAVLGYIMPLCKNV